MTKDYTTSAPSRQAHFFFTRECLRNPQWQQTKANYGMGKKKKKTDVR